MIKCFRVVSAGRSCK